MSENQVTAKKQKPRPKPTFEEVEELALLTYAAVKEFGGTEEKAKAAAQAVWKRNPHV